MLDSDWTRNPEAEYWAYFKAPVGSMLADQTKIDRDTVFMNAFMERQYLGRKEVPGAAIRIQNFTDLMMQDKGLRTIRNGMHMPASCLVRASVAGRDVRVVHTWELRWDSEEALEHGNQADEAARAAHA